MAENITKAIIGLAIGAILIATIGVTSIGILENTTSSGSSGDLNITGNWGTGTIAIFGILGVIVVIAFLLLILKYADIV